MLIDNVLTSRLMGLQVPRERIDYMQWFARKANIVSLEYSDNPQEPLNFTLVQQTVVVFERFVYRIGSKEGMPIDEQQFTISEDINSLMESTFYSELEEKDRATLNDLLGDLAKARTRRGSAETEFHTLHEALQNAPDTASQLRRLERKLNKRVDAFNDAARALVAFTNDNSDLGTKLPIIEAVNQDWWVKNDVNRFYNAMMDIEDSEPDSDSESQIDFSNTDSNDDPEEIVKNTFDNTNVP